MTTVKEYDELIHKQQQVINEFQEQQRVKSLIYQEEKSESLKQQKAYCDLLFSEFKQLEEKVKTEKETLETLMKGREEQRKFEKIAENKVIETEKTLGQTHARFRLGGNDRH